MSESKFNESDLTPQPNKPMSITDSKEFNRTIDISKRIGYGEAVADLYQILKARKGGDTLTWEDLDLVTEMMKKEVERFMPKDGNAYDLLPSKLNSAHSFTEGSDL